MMRYTVKKCYLRPLYFAQKCPQNAGNAVSETQNSGNFQVVVPPEPPTEICCHFTARVYGPLPVRNCKASKWVPVQAWRTICYGHTTLEYRKFLVIFMDICKENLKDIWLFFARKFTQRKEIQ